MSEAGVLEAMVDEREDVATTGTTDSPAFDTESPIRSEPLSFSLWIDAVGGYLIVPSDQVVVGQADPEVPADIPIVADLSGAHLTIVRGRDGYHVVPQGPVSIGDRRLTGPEALVSGDVLTLSGGVKLRFERPHPLSASARLTFVSRHRTRPWSDGIVLMGESCLLGPHDRDHVKCRGWAAELVLHRRDGELGARYPEPIEVDGITGSGTVRLGERSRVIGPDFSFSLEPIERGKS